mmetsp:Transcript_14286/g.30419  ORF Transcript_14286/g.30419 Transcript_14286/m.30419 type:complete len:204 (-) Transcript_14286:691-1302(-)
MWTLPIPGYWRCTLPANPSTMHPCSPRPPRRKITITTQQPPMKNENFWPLKIAITPWNACSNSSTRWSNREGRGTREWERTSFANGSRRSPAWTPAPSVPLPRCRRLLRRGCRGRRNDKNPHRRRRRRHPRRRLSSTSPSPSDRYRSTTSPPGPRKRSVPCKKPTSDAASAPSTSPASTASPIPYSPTSFAIPAPFPEYGASP